MSIRVVHITTIDMGLRYLLLNQMRSLQQDGYEVIGVSRPGPDVAAIEAAGIRHVPVPLSRTPFSPFQDIQGFLALWKVLRELKPTIVHTHNPKPTLYGQIAARLAGVPVVVNTLHGYIFHDGSHPLARQVFIAIEKLAVRFADVVLSQNSEDIETARRENICHPPKIKPLGNGIDLNRFNPDRISTETRRSLRADLGIPAEAPVVGFVGRLVVEKGILELLEAARAVREVQPEVRFLFVGPVDTHKPDAITPDVAAVRGLGDCCVFTGTMREDMPELYSVMDMLVLPSHREGYPRAPMEASAMGIPSIVTDIRGCREVVDHQVNGLLVPLKDPGALASAILSLLQDRDLVGEMGGRAREVAGERFDELKVFDKVKAEYLRLLAEKGFQAPSAAEPTHGSRCNG